MVVKVPNEGRHEAMPFETFERLLRTYATKDVSFHYEKEGAYRGLPPDVLTVMFGDVKDGLWFNVRKGEIPEETQIEYRPRPLSEYDRAVLAGAIRRVGGRQRPINTNPIKVPKHLGWRALLLMIGGKGLLRPNQELRDWLGDSMYNEIFTAVAQTDAMRLFMTDDGYRVSRPEE